MSVNKYKPYVFVLPEDDANRQMANGFHLNVSTIRQLQVLEVAGGWNEVLKRFTSVHVMEMERDKNRFMVLLIDFDGNLNRSDRVKASVPNHLSERVFVFGALTNSEDLRKANLGSYEEVGSALAEDCRGASDTTWGHQLLRHNGNELDRLRTHVRQILF